MSKSSYRSVDLNPGDLGSGETLYGIPLWSKQLLREEWWRLLPRALDYSIHLFPLTSANQHKLEGVRQAQKNKPQGENRGQQRRSWPPSLWVGARGGWGVLGDALKTGAFRQEAKQYFWSPIITDQAILLHNILACSTGQIMLSVGNWLLQFPRRFWSDTAVFLAFWL